MNLRFPLVQRLVPAALKDDQSTQQRALGVVVFNLAMLFWVPVYIVVFLALDAPVSARIVAAAGVLLVTNLLLLQRWPLPALCGHILTAICWFTYTALTVINAGHNSPPVWWHATVPAFAVLALGPRGGLFWLLASAAVITLFYAARLLGIDFPQEVPKEGMWFLEFSGLLGLMYCIFMLTFGFKKVQQRAQRALNEALVRARAADRAKSQFLANMSHEIRTPMTAILGYTELLFDRSFDPAASRDALATVKRNGDHLLAIINDILDLSKIEAGRLSIEMRACSPQEVVHEVVGLMRGRAEIKGLRFETLWNEPLPGRIETDPTRLRQILLNLVGNAIKFTERGSVSLEISATTGGAPGVLSFAIRDTGIGLSDEQIQKLFQPFVQADNSMSRRFGGTGLGLAICQRLAELLGGSILVASEVGRGSAFTLSLPVTGNQTDAVSPRHGEGQSAPHSQRPPESPFELAPLAGYRVLLAEDSLDNQRLIQHIVTRAGALVSVADDGKQACELALSALQDERPFSVLLMDMQMPVLDGYEATRRLRQAGYDRPIVALTAHSMGADREKCRNAGCDDYATKPIKRDELITLIRQYAEQLPPNELWQRH